MRANRGGIAGVIQRRIAGQTVGKGTEKRDKIAAR